MRRWIATLLMLGAAEISAQKPASALTAAHSTAMSDSVRRFLADFQAASAAGEWDRVVSLYTTDARFRWIESGVVTARSASDIAGYLRQMPRGQGYVTTFTETEVLPLAPGLAAIVTLFETKFGDPASGGFRFGGAMSVIAIHQAEGWRFLHGHASGPVPRGR